MQLSAHFANFMRAMPKPVVCRRDRQLADGDARRAIETVCARKPATVGLYEEKLRRLLSDSQLAAAHPDAIDESVIDAYNQRRTRQCSVPLVAGLREP
jgi:hypothetical protein